MQWVDKPNPWAKIAQEQLDSLKYGQDDDIFDPASVDCVLTLWVNAATVINDINSAREPPSRRYLDVSTIVGGNFEDLRKLIEEEFHLRVFESAIVKIVLRLDDPDTDADVPTEKRQPGLANFA